MRSVESAIRNTVTLPRSPDFFFTVTYYAKYHLSSRVMKGRKKKTQI